MLLSCLLYGPKSKTTASWTEAGKSGEMDYVPNARFHQQTHENLLSPQGDPQPKRFPEGAPYLSLFSLKYPLKDGKIKTNTSNVLEAFTTI